MKHTTLFRSILPLCIAGTALFFGACDDNEETEEIGSLLFESKNVTLALDETVQLRVRLYRPGSTENTWYDTTANPYNLQWSSGDPSVASVDAQGRLTGHAIGSTVIRCAMPDNSVHATTRVTVHDGTGESLANYPGLSTTRSYTAGRSTCNATPSCRVSTSRPTARSGISN